ncbi:MAG: OmpH family outer membrane protein [Treponemataceae bacterium]
MKRFLIIGVFAASCLIPAAAQQLTRFAVIDLQRVFTTFYRDSKAVRDFEERSARVQADVDRMTAELQGLQRTKVDAESAKDSAGVLRLDQEITKKTDFLREYYRVKTAELEDQKKKLSQSSTFYQQVYDQIRSVAESDGYSIVLNLKDSSGIIWYSPTVDITDSVIQNLNTKAGR